MIVCMLQTVGSISIIMRLFCDKYWCELIVMSAAGSSTVHALATIVKRAVKCTCNTGVHCADAYFELF